ncbi:MAG: sulfatase-like hydrolase/transferase [Planctomycetota bacterium]
MSVIRVLLACVAMVAAVGAGASAVASTGSQPPNFVLLLSDDQGWTETSVAMHPGVPGSKSSIVQTPYLEMLAEDGMVFSAAYAPAPVCAPTRASLLTGISCAALNWTKAGPAATARANYPMLGAEQDRSIDAELVTLPEMLRDAGYATAHFGKWHLNSGGPEAHGYDASDGNIGNEASGQHGPPNPVDIFGMGHRAADFMAVSQRAGKPFFIQMSYLALHSPENALPETVAKYRAMLGNGRTERPAQRAALVENLDTGVGQVLATIDELGLADNTYVIYMSDNGANSGAANRQRGNRAADASPISGGKGDLGEGGIRVPFIVRGPGVLPGAYCHERVVGYDLYPTLCALAGVRRSLPDAIEGGDLSGLFATGRGEVERSRDAMVFHFPHYQADTPHSSIYLDDWKLTYWYEDRTSKLFNLADDLAERRDLSEQQPRRAEQMRRLLAGYLEDVDASLPTVNDSYDPAQPSVSQQGGRNRQGRGEGERRPRR